MERGVLNFLYCKWGEWHSVSLRKPWVKPHICWESGSLAWNSRRLFPPCNLFTQATRGKTPVSYFVCVCVESRLDTNLGLTSPFQTSGTLLTLSLSLFHTSHPIKAQTMDDNRDFAWEKPAWATKGPGLRKTGRGDQMVNGGDLAAPITDLPHMDKNGPFRKPGWTGDVDKIEKPTEDLAKPITSLPHSGNNKSLEFEKPDWTKKPVLHASDKGEALKSGKEIARPIGGIKPVEDDYDD